VLEEILKYVSVFIISTVKFIGGPLAGISMHLSYLETVLFTVAGMMTSVLVFSYIGRAVSRWYSRYRREKQKPVFGKKSRRIVRIWSNFGIIGIAFFTPLLLTPIFGTIVAAVFGVPRRQILLHMLWSAVLWSLVLTYMVFEFQEVAARLL
jgi:uncharacterized membrane protein